MIYLGDRSTGSTLHFAFTTVTSTGAATAFSSGAVTVQFDGSTVFNTTGITLTSTHGAVVGRNNVSVEMAGTSTFYIFGGSYSAFVSSGGTADANLAGYTLAHWTIGKGRAFVSTAVNISTAALISTANVFIASAVQSTVAADVQLWRGAAPSTLGTNSNVVPSSTAAFLTLGDKTGFALATTGLDAASTGVSGPVWNETLAEIVTLPAASTTARAQLSRMYHGLTNRLDVTSTAKTFYDSSGSTMWLKALTDDGGRYSEAKASTL